MLKYLQIIKITFQEYLVYRLNFLLWRFRSFVFFLTLFFFWLAIYADRQEFLGYQKSQMFVYVVGIAFFRSVILGSRSAELAGQIRSGQLTKLILRPIDIFSFWFAHDLTDKFLNFFFTVFEIGLVLAIFKFPFHFPRNFETYISFAVLAILAMFLYFFLSFSLSVTAFWTEEIWATRWLFGVVFLEFLAGAYFPIDILPKALASFISWTPFPYMVFFPLKIWLEQLSTLMVIRAVFVCLIWLVFFYWLAHFLWRKGVRNYGAYGG